MSTTNPITHADGQGESLWYDGGLLTFKLTGSQTGGAFLLFEVRMPQGKATPLHTHQELETFYVLEGRILVDSNGTQQVFESGAVVSAPPGMPHAFLVQSPTARLLVMVTLASSVQEAFFRDAGDPATDLAATPPPGDLRRVFAAAERAGLNVLGPPPFAAPGKTPQHA